MANLNSSVKKIINKLETEGLFELNSGIMMPDVVQRIAVISSETAAGYQDFYNQLKNNPYGFSYKIDLYNCAVQGLKVERETRDAIDEIVSSDVPYHAVAIMRGGGSKLDLAGYDNYEIAKAIALSDLPFIIGIGHDIDSTVVDLVSCLSLKTPTAVADFLIEHTAQFESYCVDISRSIGQEAMQNINLQQMAISNQTRELYQKAKHLLTTEGFQLERLSTSLSERAMSLINNARHMLDKSDLKIAASDPQRIMKRGFVYVMHGDNHISSAKEIVVDDTLTVTFKDGKRITKVMK